MSTVLIVEDEANVMKLVAINLTSRGYTVLEAEDIHQALSHLQYVTPDLIVLDIKLPDSTGWDFLTGLARDPVDRPAIPVVVMTASIMDAEVDQKKFPNVVEVLVKPFSATKLVTAVERALDSYFIH